MKKDFKNIFMMLVITIALIVMTIGILNGLKLFYPELPDRALFGESTGFVSVIFSGFSVILVIFTLSLQMDDLKKTKEIEPFVKIEALPCNCEKISNGLYKKGNCFYTNRFSMSSGLDIREWYSLESAKSYLVSKLKENI